MNSLRNEEIKKGILVQCYLRDPLFLNDQNHLMLMKSVTGKSCGPWSQTESKLWLSISSVTWDKLLMSYALATTSIKYGQFRCLPVRHKRANTCKKFQVEPGTK